jgi:hypothetical protein
LSRYRSSLVALAAASLLLPGCVGPQPVRERVLADAAIRFAEKNGAPKHAKGALFQAQQEYENAERLMQMRRHDEARDTYRRAREWAEKAETSARLKRMESGDFAP